MILFQIIEDLVSDQNNELIYKPRSDPTQHFLNIF